MKFLTPQQVADMLQVDCDTIIAWLKQNKLPAVKIGDVWRIEEERLQNYLQQELDKNSIEEKYADYEDNVVPKKGRRGRKPTGKYDGLKEVLKNTKGKLINMTFAEVQDHMGDSLPQSAYRLRPWWANDYTHSQARAWLHSGWETRNVDLKNHKVTFERIKK